MSSFFENFFPIQVSPDSQVENCICNTYYTYVINIIQFIQFILYILCMSCRIFALENLIISHWSKRFLFEKCMLEN